MDNTINVDDFKSKFTNEDIPNMFHIIFKRQHELTLKYLPIEIATGLRWTDEIPVVIDSGKGQAQLKDMAWRVVEEVAESMESLLITKDSDIHPKEELADGLHFLTEMMILADITSEELSSSDIQSLIAIGSAISTIDEALTEFIIRIGIAMNNLKMKPWKQTPYKTDKVKLKKDLIKAYQAYSFLMLKIMTPMEILDLYFRKSQVNNFRIESKY